MNRLLGIWLLTCLVLTYSCEVHNPEEDIPAYVRIDDVVVETSSEQGSNSDNLTDLWVIVNNKTQGIYEFPVSFPLLEEGTKPITFFAGIKDNGISTTRTIYPFLDPITVDVSLAPGEETSIPQEQLKFVYKENIKFLVQEDFESSFQSQTFQLEPISDQEINYSRTGNEDEVFEGTGSLKAELNDDRRYFGVMTEIFEGPEFISGSPVYLEFDYKITHPILIGFIKYENIGTGGLIGTKVAPFSQVNPRDDWNKIYINITNRLAFLKDDEQARIYIESYHLGGSSENTLLIDNLKVLTFE